MTEQEILQIFRDSGALLEGHFILTSGLHSPQYVEKFRVLEKPRYTEILCREIAGMFKDSGITVVVGPMTGGIILAHETARQLGVKAIFTERVEGKMQFRRGFKLQPEDKVLIVEDIITTGGSVLEVIEAINHLEVKPVIAGVCCLVDRSGGKADFGYTFKPLLKMDAQAFKPGEVPEWLEKIPVTKPGSTGK